MEDLKKFNEVFENIENQQEVTEIMELLRRINELIDKEQENFYSLCYYFSKLKAHFKEWSCKNYKYGAYTNKNGRWYYERIIIDFGLSERTVNKMIQVADRFLEKVGAESKIRPAFLGFNKSKLFELLSLSDAELEKAIETKRISADMSFRLIREYVKSVKGSTSAPVYEKHDDEWSTEGEYNEEDIPMSFDPKKEYDLEYYKSQSKSKLINMCLDLQRELQKYLKKKKQ